MQNEIRIDNNHETAPKFWGSKWKDNPLYLMQAPGRKLLKNYIFLANILKINTILIFSISILIIGIFYIYFLWCHPVADDLYRAALTREIGPFRNIYFSYLTWSSRWMGNGIEFLLPYFVDISKSYQLILFIFSLIIVISIRFFVNLVVKGSKKQLLKFAITFMLYAVYIINIPFLSESFYWLTGMIENLIVVFISILFFVLFNRKISEISSKYKITNNVIIFILAFIIPGFHEMYGIVFYILLIGIIILFFIKKPNQSFFLGELAFCSTIGIIIVIFSPGNYSRLGTVSNTPILEKFSISILNNSFLIMLDNLKNWILSPTLIVMTLIVIFLVPLSNSIKESSEKTSFTWKIFFIFFYFFSIFLCFFIVSTTIGYIPKRTLSGIYTIFFFGWVGIASMLMPKLPLFPAFRQHFMIAILTLILFFSSLNQKNLIWAVEDLEKGQKYHRQMLKRYKSIYQLISNGVYDIVLEDDIIWPRLFPKHLDVRKNCSNMHWSLYFNADSVSKRPGCKNVYEIDSSGFLAPRKAKFGFSKNVEFKIHFKKNIRNKYILEIKGKALRKEDQKIEILLNGRAIGFHTFSDSSYENVMDFDTFSIGPCSFHLGENILSVQSRDLSRHTKVERNLLFVFGNISIYAF